MAFGIRPRRRRDGEGSRIAYRRWDGTQIGFDASPDDVLSAMSEELLYHGDVNSALRGLLQRGFDGEDGERVEGIRELIERVRRERKQRLEQADLGGIYDEVNDALNEVLDLERSTLDEISHAAESSTDQRRAEITPEAAQERRMSLEFLPKDLAGKMASLDEYDFTSAEAAQRFEELKEQLRQQLIEQAFEQISDAMANPSAEDLARMKDMMAELNQMLEQRARGEEPDFDGFMERYGDMFPENPQTLDELLEVLARRSAAASQLMASMTPEQRAQLQALSEQLLGDIDLAFEMDRLQNNLRDAFPQLDWDRVRQPSGQGESMGLGEATDLFSDLADLDELEEMLRRATDPAALAEIDTDRLDELVGPDAARSLGQLSKMVQDMEDAGLIRRTEDGLELTPRALRKLGNQALKHIFDRLSADHLGAHQLEQTGRGHERTFETRQWQFGDPFDLDIQQTVRNAVRRRAAEGRSGSLLPLSVEDFEIEQAERTVQANTVLLLDLSMSMPLRGNFLPAKKVALALHSLISSGFPRDYLGIVGFGFVAREVSAKELPEVSWDFEYGTNMHHAFTLARHMLSGRSGSKQIIMITDGEPTAHVTAAGHPVFSYPPVRETLEATMLEVRRLTRADIRINTFMLEPDYGLKAFVEQLTRFNRGRAFFTDPDTLGDYVMLDFLEHRTSRRSA